jgi:hypothetical protein
VPLLFSNCNKDLHNPRLKIRFTHTVNGDPVQLSEDNDSLNYTNASGQSYNIHKLQYLISQISMHTEWGTSSYHEGPHFINLSDPSTLELDIGDISGGIHTSLRFCFGSPSTEDAYIEEEFHHDMIWPDSLGGGYHYMKLEGNFENTENYYMIHTGGLNGNDYSFWMEDSPHISNNYETLIFVADLGEDFEITINMEISEWFTHLARPPYVFSNNNIMDNVDEQMYFSDPGEHHLFKFSLCEN